jgi:hypothetical protein
MSDTHDLDVTADEGSGTRRDRPWLGIQFDCCNIYTRVYRNREGTAYVGFCPRCASKIRLAVGSGGTSARFFTAE